MYHLNTLEAANLSHRYPDTGRDIDRISLRLTQDSLTVSTRRIGSGKTALLQVMLGLLPRDKGEVYWNSDTKMEDYLLILKFILSASVLLSSVHNSNATITIRSPTTVTANCSIMPIKARRRPAAVTRGQMLGDVCFE